MLISDYLSQDLVQLGLENLQRRLHNISVQPVTMFSYPFSGGFCLVVWFGVLFFFFYLVENSTVSIQDHFLLVSHSAPL